MADYGPGKRETYDCERCKDREVVMKEGPKGPYGQRDKIQFNCPECGDGERRL